ncbi:MAG: hypothetical protein EOM10_13715 [Opitutae bacterium]|nr:hypothetical protein [Opitutae bacterium]
MKLGIMQPYFFPYPGYFDLIRKTDRWVVFDTPQYTPRTWMNRNRILHPAEGWQYITVPVEKFPRFAPMTAIRVKEPEASRDKVLRQLEHYRRHAPRYDDAVAVVTEGFARRRSDSLVDVNVACLAAVCEYLGMAFNHALFSEMDLRLPEIDHPGKWALEICRAMGADEYVNAPGGRELFDPKAFRESGIALRFGTIREFVYPTRPYAFTPHLSILDCIMWCTPEEITAFLDEGGTEPA